MAAPANTEPDAVYSPRRIHVEASRGDPQQKKEAAPSIGSRRTTGWVGCASIFENNHVAPVRVCACVRAYFVVARPHAVVRRVLVLLR